MRVIWIDDKRPVGKAAIREEKSRRRAAKRAANADNKFQRRHAKVACLDATPVPLVLRRNTPTNNLDNVYGDGAYEAINKQK